VTALEGLRVVDLSTTLIGAQMSQVLADFGAEVVLVEPPGGSPLRDHAAWPAWSRGKRSVVLDLHEPADLQSARDLISGADVLVETWRPGVAERLGLDHASLASSNPRLVHASVTAFGADHPWSQLKGYDPVVMAKIGGLDAYAGLSDRPGPSFVATPYCSWSAGQLALQGILAALVERERSGLGQHVASTMVQGVLAQDIGNWLVRLVGERFGDAFTAVPGADEDALVPNSDLYFRLLVALSADGRWMQFAQNSPRLWEAFLRVLGVEWAHDDPFLRGSSESDDPKARVAFWEQALEVVRSKTYDEWVEVFEREPDVWGELFRIDNELLRHPQMEHDARVATIVDPELGPVRQLGPLVSLSRTPAQLGRPAPRLDADRDVLVPPLPAAAPPVAAAAAPLAGVTIVELGTFFAGPFGASVLADYGARVIKVEQCDGDPMRRLFAFPEIGGIKVLQGKESVAVDITTEQGRAIVLDLVRRADVVLQSFRGGVAERLGFGPDDLLAENPDLVYLGAYGYGEGGPAGRKPAFAPTFGAASGLGYRNVGGEANVPQRPDLTLDQVKRYSLRLSTATRGLVHADGLSGLGTATALLLGILAKRRGCPGQSMTTSMLSTMAHTLSDEMIEYEGRPPSPAPDADLLGLGPTYRLYEVADGWVFLAAPTERDRTALAKALDIPAEVLDDGSSLAAFLGAAFADRGAVELENELLAVDVTCAAVATGPVEDLLMLRDAGRSLGIVVDAEHAVLGDYPRLAPLVSFGRSPLPAPTVAPLCGDHTEAVLAELGYDVDAVAALRAAGVVA
jgi:crotonobetainyl-CoA:carnitine CoA-transferase CaiB-like acyl-CoA transferase